MDKKMIEIEVAYALPDRQKIILMCVAEGTNARQAVLDSGMQKHFAGLDLQESPLGVFSRTLAKPEEYQLEDGDRVEIYRPLLVDPKEVRKQRAAKAAKEKAK